MEEKFRDWSPRGDIRIKYKNERGEPEIWEANQEELLSNILKIVKVYSDDDIKLTNRQLYYQLVGGALIPNAIEVYKRICNFLTDARYGGYIDWEAIEDRGRVPKKHAEWDDIKDLVNSAVYSYRLPRWKDQEYHVELYCEKEAMDSILRPVSDKYHIYFGYNKGYSGAAAMYQLAQRVGEMIEDHEKEVILLYLGDHDPSGLDMVRDIGDRINEFLTEGSNSIEPNFEVIHVALTLKQVKKYNPPPNPAKISDPRAKGYIREHGNVSWELDALKPEVLIKLTSNAIEKYLDMDAYNEIIQREQGEVEKLRDFADKLAEEEGE